MSGFAELLHSFDFTVTGSDWHESKITDHLESLGIQVVYGQKAENITDSIDLVVYTAAVKSDNPEIVRAKELEIPMMERAAMVGQVMKNYSSAIAIPGGASGTADAQLQKSHCRVRYPWQNHDHFHDFHDSSGRGRGSHHFRGRHSACYRRQYPGRTLRAFHYRSL